MRRTEKKLMLLNRSAISTAVLLALYGGSFGAAHAQEGADSAATASAASNAPRWEPAGNLLPY